jgi:uncharacterized membrane protein
MLATTAVLIAAGAALHALESAMIPYFQPWRLGLANTVTLVALEHLGAGPALAVVVCRCLLGGLLSGQFPGLPFILSIAGGLVSAIAMAGLIKGGHWFSHYGVSVAGALSSNAAQLAVLSFTLAHTPALFGLAVWLWPTALAGGLICGFLASAVLSRLRTPGQAPR